ncbi:S66 family peptidase [Microlunatus speluncae]|uniref:S66 family peptidase n=1 Tax=Microlunatus speluncae TaxID=2594267 RepID=UPI001C2CE807|nr:S66 peptidase family protein [Microlunatus speluncae]
MTSSVVPRRLTAGDRIRVIAPSMSRPVVMEHDNTEFAVRHLTEELGLEIDFGDHVDEIGPLDTAGVAARVDDLHAAFADDSVAGILTVIGGYLSNQLLPHLDFDLIAAHPKVFCGYSDITALANAIHAVTGLVTYVGPHWSSFGMRDHFEPTQEWFRRATFTTDPIVVEPSTWWSDDAWFADQDHRELLPTDGWWSLRPGEATGPLLGGNLCTLNLLQGTAWMPSLAGRMVFVEDDYLSFPALFARDLTSLFQLPGADQAAGLIIGRFQGESGVTRDHLDAMIADIPALQGKPVLANVDFGHTMPLLTIPVGGTAHLSVGADVGLTINPRR